MTINKLELEAVLNKAAPFLMQKSFLPILTHFCFSENKVTAFNDLQAIEINYESGLSCALPGALLQKMLSSLQSNALEITQKQAEVIIKSGKSKVKLPSLPDEDFIFEMPSKEDCDKIRLPLDVIGGLANCLISTSHDLANPEKSGVRLIIQDKTLEFYSTDTVSISRYRYKSNNVPECSVDIIVPEAFCEQLARLTRGKPTDVEETAYVQMYVSDKEGDTYLIVDIDSNVSIFTRLIEVEKKLGFKELFSMYEERIGTWHVIPKEILNIIDRACILTSAEDKFITTLEGKGSTLFIDTITKSGVSDDTLDFEGEIGTGRFKVNPEVVKRIASTMTQVSFCFDDNVVALEGCNGNFLHLISAKSMED